MSEIRYLVGDVFQQMATLPDGSVDLIMTSPPFLALRSYLPDDHPDKALEIGSEPDPATFVDTLLRLSAEWRRLLAPHGTICVELGDTYSGSGGAGGDYNDDGLRDGQNAFSGSARANRGGTLRASADASGRNNNVGGHHMGGNGWPEAKCKAMIPELYRIALGYGIHPLTGQPSPAGRWKVRNVVTWCRPNPPVGALGDKFRPATSDLVIACTSKDRWFDLDAVRTPPVSGTAGGKRNGDSGGYRGITDGAPRSTATDSHPAGAPPLDYWVIPPGGFSGSHYAVYPAELCVKPIQAMCPRQVCRQCGQPRRRITEATYEKTQATSNPSARGSIVGVNAPGADQSFVHGRADKIVKTLGFTDCGHGDYRNGVVLDPFAGSGTTLMVSHGHGRDAWGIDIDERNLELARSRIGPLFFNTEDAA